MSNYTRRNLLFTFKGLFWVSLILLITYLIASALFYFIGMYAFEQLQNSIFSRPILFSVPVLLVVGLVGTWYFKQYQNEQEVRARPAIANYMPLFAIIFGGALIAFALYSFGFKNNSESRLSDVKSKRKAVISKPSAVYGVEKNSQSSPNPPSQIAKKEVKKDTVIIPPLVDLSTDNPAHAPGEYAESSLRELKYQIISKAYLYNSPDVSTRRKAYINSNNSYKTLLPKDEKNGFIYVVFTSDNGHTTLGWLNKKDLRPVHEIVYNDDK